MSEACTDGPRPLARQVWLPAAGPGEPVLVLSCAGGRTSFRPLHLNFLRRRAPAPQELPVRAFCARFRAATEDELTAAPAVPEWLALLAAGVEGAVSAAVLDGGGDPEMLRDLATVALITADACNRRLGLRKAAACHHEIRQAAASTLRENALESLSALRDLLAAPNVQARPTRRTAR